MAHPNRSKIERVGYRYSQIELVDEQSSKEENLSIVRKRWGMKELRINKHENEQNLNERILVKDISHTQFMRLIDISLFSLSDLFQEKEIFQNSHLYIEKIREKLIKQKQQYKNNKIVNFFCQQKMGDIVFQIRMSIWKNIEPMMTQTSEFRLLEGLNLVQDGFIDPWVLLNQKLEPWTIQ